MSDLRMIAALCSLCEEQSRLIQALVFHLAELGDTAMQDEIAAADEKYCKIIGDGELL